MIVKCCDNNTYITFDDLFQLLGEIFGLGIIENPKPPNTRSMYLRCELALKSFAESLEIDFEEMDLLLWSMKTGVILK